MSVSSSVFKAKLLQKSSALARGQYKIISFDDKFAGLVSISKNQNKK